LDVYPVIFFVCIIICNLSYVCPIKLIKKKKVFLNGIEFPSPHWVIPEDPHSPHGGDFCHPDWEEESLFLIIVSILGHPRRWGWGGEGNFFLWGRYGCFLE
jgi:hypothetical protein